LVGRRGEVALDGAAHGAKIHFAAKGEWTFPAGTVFVKDFKLPVDDTNPNVLRRLETRLLVCDTNGSVYGASYKWRADNSDADLVNAGTNEDITITTATGTRLQRWYYPGRQDCLTCHTPQSGGVLGVKTRQLNGDFKYPSGVTDNQLRAWNHLGLFDTKLNEAALPRFARPVNITNTAAPLELRVRSYLDANCAQCHRPGGVGAFFDARFDTPLKLQNLVNGPVANQLGIAGARIIVPGDTNKSILLRRFSLVGDNQMPPLARNRVDEPAVAVIARWIASLRPAAPTLPKGWSQADIGSASSPGEASYLNGSYNLIAANDDIWESADSILFASRSLSGDGEITAHVAAMQYTDPWAKAGVMLREDFSPGAKYALMAITGNGGYTFQWRPIADTNCRNADGPPLNVPRWVKLVRKGDTITGFVSLDGIDWRQVDSMTFPMKKTIHAGLGLSGHNNTMLNSTLFDNVVVKP